MNLKRIVSAIAVAALVSASTLGIGAGVSAADTGHPNTGTSTSHTSQIQSVDWHGRDHWHGRGYGDGWRGIPWWHPRPWGWHW